MAFDTNALIYFFERHGLYHPVLRPVFLMAASAQILACASAVSLTEVLTLPMRAGNSRLVERYRRGLVRASDFSLIAVTVEVAERAAEIRAEFGWRSPDAIVAATAIEEGWEALITNDERFKGLRGIRALYLNDFVA